MKERLLPFLIKNVLWKAALWWCSSLKITVMGNERVDELRETDKKYVVSFWHGSMLVGWFLNRPEKNKRMSALVSQSKDGEYLSAIIERWGFTMIRGSSHIGGKEAMQLMVDAVEGGSSLSITPDGPRGPRHEMKMGAIRVAQKTGVPLVLMGIAMKNKKQLRSWDKFELPRLFSNVTVCYSEPVIVPKELDGVSLDEFKLKMQNQLNELTGRAEKN
jgi:lysophospholipid acyltransferase (LPLAT)-like uncharacterized protein